MSKSRNDKLNEKENNNNKKEILICNERHICHDDISSEHTQ